MFGTRDTTSCIIFGSDTVGREIYYSISHQHSKYAFNGLKNNYFIIQLTKWFVQDSRQQNIFVEYFIGEKYLLLHFIIVWMHRPTVDILFYVITEKSVLGHWNPRELSLNLWSCLQTVIVCCKISVQRKTMPRMAILMYLVKLRNFIQKYNSRLLVKLFKLLNVC